MSDDFKQFMRDRIIRNGPLTVAQYMNLALYHPEYGYYRNRNPLGQQGDFITSPEISQMFGEIIGLCFMDLWQRMGKPSLVHLIEFGPGQGTLMQDFLSAISPEFKQAIDLHFVDISPILKKEQQQRIELLNVRWHDDIEAAFAACQKAPVFVVANEFFDALPIHQYIKTEDGWDERLVAYEKEFDSFVHTSHSLDSKTITELNLPISLQTGETFEVSLGARYMTKLMSNHICRQGGMALLIDYGHIKSAAGDTLQAVRQHAYHDILTDPGMADLTAHVDFEAIKLVAESQGTKVYGPTTQGSFLVELGIDIRASNLKQKANTQQRAEIERSLYRLTHPTQMGNLFKVMAITAPKIPVPCGFALCTQVAC